MHLRGRFTLAVLWLASTCMVIVWMARRGPLSRDREALRVRERGTGLELHADAFVAFSHIRPGATPELSTIPSLGRHSPLQVVGFSVVRFGANTLRPPTNAQCMFDGPRRLESVLALDTSVQGVDSRILAPHNNNTWVVLTDENGTIYHPSERFCVDYIHAHYIDDTSVSLGSALWAIPPHRRATHRCASVPRWVGADCRIGTGERALLMDCITTDKIMAQTEAQCSFEHMCCHEIKLRHRPFVAYPNGTNPGEYSIFNNTNGTPAVFTGNRYDEFLDVVSYAVANRNYVGYNETSYTPALFSEETDETLGLWLVVDELPVFSPRDQCYVDRLWKQTNGSRTQLNGSWTFMCASL